MEKELGEPKEIKPKVLFVDDEESLRMLIGNFLEETLGLSTVIVDSAEKAIEEIQKGNFTHILTDGLEGNWKKVAQAAQEKEIDVTVITGDEEVKEQVLEERGIRLIPKPMRLEQIKEIFEESRCS